MANGSGEDAIGPHAACFYAYDSEHHVTQELVDGGTQEYTYSSYTYYTCNDADFNGLRCVTTEKGSDGSTYVVYTNVIGQVLAADMSGGGQEWCTYNEYNSDGQLTLQAPSSAVTSIGIASDSENGDYHVLPSITSAGPVQEYLYGGELTYPGGCMCAGYLETVSLADGLVEPASGDSYYNSDVTTETSYAYSASAQTAIDPATGQLVAIYPEQSETDYPDGSPETTTYADYYYSNSLQVNEVVTTSPTVSDGPGAAVTRDWYNAFGKLIWQMDAGGFLTENTYYPLTGNLSTTIQDVNTTSGPTDVFYPYQQWNTPTGGGMNAETDYEYDGLGRQNPKPRPEAFGRG